MKPRSQAARDAVARGHVRLAKVDYYQPSGFVTELPIHKGEVTFSLSSSTGDRSGRLELAGYNWEWLLSPANAGWVLITIVIDDTPFVLGEFPILEVGTESPGGRVQVALGDWCYRRQRSIVEEPANSLQLGVKVITSAKNHVSHVMPWAIVEGRDDTGGAMMPSESKLTGGADVWAALQQAANLANARLVMPNRTTVDLRRYDPAGPVVEQLDDVLHTATRRLSASKGDACNRVIVVVDGADGATFRSVQTLTTGPYAYGVGFGLAQIVENVRVNNPSQAAADAEALRIANRRFGALKTVTATIPVMPWLELGDVVAFNLQGDYETLAIETMTMPLNVDQPMRITARDVGWRDF